MDVTLNDPSVTSEQDRKISATVRREGGRLRNFIRRRVLDAAEAEDILQEVLYELVAAHRLMQPIEQAGAWLMRVARNRIIDRFRKKRAEPFSNSPLLVDDEDDGSALVQAVLIPLSLASVLASLVLATIVSNIALGPLRAISRNLDNMATGDASAALRKNTAFRKIARRC